MSRAAHSVLQDGSLVSTSSPSSGSQICSLGHSFVWSDGHIPHHQLQPWRYQGDQPIDEILDVMQPSFHADVLALIKTAAKNFHTQKAQNNSEDSAQTQGQRHTSPPPPTTATATATAPAPAPAPAPHTALSLTLTSQVTDTPPPTSPSCPSLEEMCSNFLVRYSSVPPWLDLSLLAEGQRAFLRYSSGAMLVLLYSSLVGGFGAPVINRVLTATNYLSGTCAQTYRRLVETTVMIALCMNPFQTHTILAEGEAWEACLRVRILHAQVRRLLKRRKDWQLDTFGVPINQEDLLVTLLSFSFNPAYSLARVGITWNQREKEAYTHLWKYIGWLNGVDELLLEKALCSYQQSQVYIESIAYHIVHPDDSSAYLAHHVLYSVYAYFPPQWPIDFHIALARQLMGEEWADSLQLPQHHIFFKYRAKFLFFTIKCWTLLSQVYGLQNLIRKLNFFLMMRRLKIFFGQENVQSSVAYKRKLEIQQTNQPAPAKQDTIFQMLQFAFELHEAHAPIHSTQKMNDNSSQTNNHRESATEKKALNRLLTDQDMKQNITQRAISFVWTALMMTMFALIIVQVKQHLLQ